ncbi:MULTISPECIES: thioredoxin domain-containing protein [Bacillus]|jgi:thioredoxin 1|uniref:thioredoxin domain-containing protein n=1 Tax=Bacillus TaxID=1386 RepID=UPI00065DEB2C
MKVVSDWTQQPLHEQISETGKTVLYFYTPLCGTCAVAGKMVDVIEKLFPDCTFAKADINYHEDFAHQYEIESVPCLMIFDKKELKDKIYAFHSVPFLYEKLSQYQAG